MWSALVRRGRPSLAGQFLLLQLIVVAVVLGAVVAVSVHQSTREFREIRGQRMISVAENLASTPIVRDQLPSPSVRTVLAPEVDRAMNLSGASLVEIASPDGTVLVSSEPARIDTPMPLGGSLVRDGRAWSGDVTMDGRHSIVGHVPILASSGAVLALVAVSESYPSVWELLNTSGPRLFLYLGTGAGLGVLGSWLLARLIKRRTRGLEVSEIASLADHREALLHSIREGVVAVSTDGRITVLNDSALELLGLSSDAVGRHVRDVPLDPGVREFLLSGEDRPDVVLTTRTHVLSLNRRAATSQGQHIGSVTTLRDSTELASMQSQLTSHRSVTDTLRAQTHEFANQLHTISGLVQLGEYDEVTKLVGTLTRRRAEISDSVTSRLEDPAVAALVIAKTSLAAEAGVDLRLDPRSHLRTMSPALATDVITMLGNLIDNAVDVSAVAASVGHGAGHGSRADDAAMHSSKGDDAAADRPARVDVRIDDADGLTIEVSDSGPGVPDDMLDAIFSRGVTSKTDVPGGRGIGLALVRLVCGQLGGTVTVHNDAGAVFAVRIPDGPADSHRHRPAAQATDPKAETRV